MKCRLLDEMKRIVSQFRSNSLEDWDDITWENDEQEEVEDNDYFVIDKNGNVKHVREEESHE